MDREQEILSNMGLVHFICNKYVGSHESMDDMIQYGTIGLIMGVDTYDGDKGASRSTYYAVCIQREVYKALRATRKIQKDVSFETVLNTDKDGNTLTIADMLVDTTADPMRDVYKTETQQEVHELLNMLSDNPRNVLLSIYGIGRRKLNQESIAKQMGLSQSGISRQKKQALLKLRQIAEDRGVYIAG